MEDFSFLIFIDFHPSRRFYILPSFRKIKSKEEEGKVRRRKKDACCPPRNDDLGGAVNFFSRLDKIDFEKKIF